MLNEIDLSRVDLNLLVLFDTVLRQRNVARAAEQLHVSPSAVSHGLGRLRQLLNDPLFLRTPRGVVPTERATALAPGVAEVLQRVRGVLGSAQPFDPAQAQRRFLIGAPDAIATVLLAPLLRQLGSRAPGIDIGVRQLLPLPGIEEGEQAWRNAYAELESRALDIAILPTAPQAARFTSRLLYEEDFVLTLRAGHPLRQRISLDDYCAAAHLVVSQQGDPHGFVDQHLQQLGRQRRVGLTLPNFFFAFAALAHTDLICAVPRRFAQLHASTFGLRVAEAPFGMGRFAVSLVVTAAALRDEGVGWLVGEVEGAVRAVKADQPQRRRGSRAKG